MIQRREREKEREDGERLQTGQRRHFNSRELRRPESNWPATYESCCNKQRKVVSLKWHGLACVASTDDSQTVINVQERSRKRKRRGSSPERQLLCSMQKAANKKEVYRQAGHVPDQWESMLKCSPSLHRACPCSSWFFHWYKYSHGSHG